MSWDFNVIKEYMFLVFLVLMVISLILCIIVIHLYKIKFKKKKILLSTIVLESTAKQYKKIRKSCFIILFIVGIIMQIILVSRIAFILEYVFLVFILVVAPVLIFISYYMMYCIKIVEKEIRERIIDEEESNEK